MKTLSLTLSKCLRLLSALLLVRTIRLTLKVKWPKHLLIPTKIKNSKIALKCWKSLLKLSHCIQLQSKIEPGRRIFGTNLINYQRWKSNYQKIIAKSSAFWSLSSLSTSTWINPSMMVMSSLFWERLSTSYHLLKKLNWELRSWTWWSFIIESSV